MEEHSIVFVGLDVSKDRHAVAIAEGGRDGELRYLGEIGSDDASIRRLMKRLARPGVELRFCYEAGPTGYGLKRRGGNFKNPSCSPFALREKRVGGIRAKKEVLLHQCK
jgi:hypothetical protein